MADPHVFGCPCPTCVANMLNTALTHLVEQAGGFVDIPVANLIEQGEQFLSIELDENRLLLRVHNHQEVRRYIADGGR